MVNKYQKNTIELLRLLYDKKYCNKIMENKKYGNKTRKHN